MLEYHSSNGILTFRISGDLDLKKGGVSSFLLVLILLIFGGVLGRVIYITVSVRGMQAEAKLMLSYLHTLQKAQHMESDKFISFEEFYGSPIRGGDQCKQPQGAAELGFLLKWCHQQTSAPLRYSYRIVLNEGGFIGEAHSGSDSVGGSFVCFGMEDDNLWQIDKNRKLSQIKTCHSFF